MTYEESLHAKFYRTTERRLSLLLVLVGMLSGLFGSIVGVHYSRIHETLSVADNELFFWLSLGVLVVTGIALFGMVLKLEKDADNLMDQIHEENKK